VRFGHDNERKVTAISVFADGASARRDSVTAGQIAKLSGCRDTDRRRDRDTAHRRDQHHFAPPMLETAIVARDPRDKAPLYAAMTQLAEQDPLINVRQDDIRRKSMSPFTAKSKNR